MFIGYDYKTAIQSAMDSASRDGQSRYVHAYAGAWRIALSPLRGPMATRYILVLPNGTTREVEPKAC